MMKSLKLVCLVLLGVFVFISCNNNGGGGSSTTTLIGPEGGMARSSDGRLTLTFPAGAVSEDTLITIKSLNPSELPPGLESEDVEALYELGPDGIEFDEPVGVEIMTGDEPLQMNGSISFNYSDLLTTSAGGAIEPLDNVETVVDLDENTVTVTGELSHFSLFAWLVENFVSVRITNVPMSVMVGEIFHPRVRVRSDVPSLESDDPNLRFGGIILDDVLYRDISVPVVAPVSLTGQVSVPFARFDDAEGFQEFLDTYDYVCDPTGVGNYGASIIAEGEKTRVVEQEPLTLMTSDIVRRARFFKRITCGLFVIDPLPEPTPSEPEPTPMEFMVEVSPTEINATVNPGVQGCTPVVDIVQFSVMVGSGPGSAIVTITPSEAWITASPSMGTVSETDGSPNLAPQTMEVGGDGRVSMGFSSTLRFDCTKVALVPQTLNGNIAIDLLRNDGLNWRLDVPVRVILR